jgi:RNA polymerase sigma-70 factor (ECF subfamily)
MVMIVGTSLKISGETKINLNEGSNLANDGQLVAEARNDPAAFGRLYRRHYDTVFRYCVHRLFERQAAEDVTSAVFLKVVENLGRFKGTELQFRNWLYKQ